jgi:glycine/D-amino acid oxidase-like deaminating enzyme/nitrite reductase/ring-hydroxylating ferredoxin subunit
MATARQIPSLPGRAISPWLDEVERPARPRLDRDRSAEVAVVGAGIVGLTTAYELAKRGLDTVVLEGRRVASGVTGNTTAKLSSLHGLSYDSLRSTRGDEAAAAYAAANQWGIDRVEQIAAELGIECDLRRKPCYTYTEDAGRVGEVGSEVEAALALGLPAAFTVDTDLPFAVEGAIRFEAQAEFQPAAYLAGLADGLEAAGVPVYEQTRALDADGSQVRTEGGPVVSAERIVLATQIPFLDRGLFFARAHVERSYALSVRVRGPVPQGMYLQTESPGRTMRSLRWRGEELLLVGGESHELGHGDPVEKFRALERYARERFDVEGFEHRWSAHDFMSEDGMPYVGAVWPLSDRVLTVTGLRKWGLAMGTAAARMLADQIAGEENEWRSHFDPARLPPLSSAPELAKHNAESGVFFFGDRVRGGRSPAELAPGEGTVVRDGLGQRAVHRDDDGRLHALSARCTHLGCIVRWNGGERTWDCPCHGSRFTAAGEVISGPATRALQPTEASEDD